MCGVAAVFAPLPLAQREDLARAMCDLMAHRGPHGSGLFSDGDPAGLTLGHRRLSILDLSPTGAQPMTRGDLHISYNGEFYNYIEKRSELSSVGHRFVGSSDTEVLLALCQQHGVVDALPQVNGMFAFALYDRAQRSLWLARDRFGEKPLYYLLQRNICLVASEPKAIVQAARRLGIAIDVQRQTLACYLADAEHEVGDATFFAAISRVNPGEWIRVSQQSDGSLALSRGRYFQLSPQTCPSQTQSLAAADDDFRSLLTDALRLRLRSDVEVAACLSGGLDSSTLVSLAATLGQPLRTFSAIHRPGEPWDERKYIAAVVAQANVPNFCVNPEDDLRDAAGVDAFVRFLAQHDEPVGGPSVWAQHSVYRLLARHGHRVALSGQGADESLGGYGGTLPALRAELVRQARLGPLSTELATLPSQIDRALALQRAAASALRSALARRHPHLYTRWLDHRWQRSFATARYLDAAALSMPLPSLPADPPHAAAFDDRSLLHGYLYRLLVGTSLATILRYEDRNSMMASVEARAPFLDHRLVTHCLGRSASDLAGQGWTKLLLRRTLPNVLPVDVRWRRDQVGFGAPPWRWLLGPLRPWLHDLLASSRLQSLGFLRLDRLRADLAAAESGTAATSGDAEGFWRAINVAVWLDAQRLSL